MLMPCHSLHLNRVCNMAERLACEQSRLRAAKVENSYVQAELKAALSSFMPVPGGGGSAPRASAVRGGGGAGSGAGSVAGGTVKLVVDEDAARELSEQRRTLLAKQRRVVSLRTQLSLERAQLEQEKESRDVIAAMMIQGV